QLTQQLATAHEAVRNAEAERVHLKIEIEVKEHKLREVTEEADLARQKLETLTDNLAMRDTQIARLQKDLAASATADADELGRVRAERDEQEALRGQLTRALEDVRTAEADRHRLTAKVDAKERKLHEVTENAETVRGLEVRGILFRAAACMLESQLGKLKLRPSGKISGKPRNAQTRKKAAYLEAQRDHDRAELDGREKQLETMRLEIAEREHAMQKVDETLEDLEAASHVSATEVTKLREQVRNRERNIAEREMRITELEKAVLDAASHVSATEVTKLREQVRERERKIVEREMRIAELEKPVLEAASHASTTEVTELRQQVRERERKIAESEMRIADLEKAVQPSYELDHLRIEMEESTRHVADLEKTVQLRDAEIVDCKLRIVEVEAQLKENAIQTADRVRAEMDSAREFEREKARLMELVRARDADVVERDRRLAEMAERVGDGTPVLCGIQPTSDLSRLRAQMEENANHSKSEESTIHALLASKDALLASKDALLADRERALTRALEAERHFDQQRSRVKAATNRLNEQSRTLSADRAALESERKAFDAAVEASAANLGALVRDNTRRIREIGGGGAGASAPAEELGRLTEELVSLESVSVVASDLRLRTTQSEFEETYTTLQDKMGEIARLKENEKSLATALAEKNVVGDESGRLGEAERKYERVCLAYRQLRDSRAASSGVDNGNFGSSKTRKHGESLSALDGDRAKADHKLIRLQADLKEKLAKIQSLTDQLSTVRESLASERRLADERQATYASHIADRDALLACVHREVCELARNGAVDEVRKLVGIWRPHAGGGGRGC
ncbi:hypothetical protein BDK51DRAFT_41608, partial [Blyttiomyces helicus]